ncbi:DUF5317 domain-containing protein [Clostridium formicaceticum]|uniref:DUF5317 domain-containing protein n=1 Tax=Clostridium formicaceticum TaxID=1497 RepID=A0AAC9RI78_9CLOT|nr:DUF5317 domain-containing protein [Clostridium formicaceticum]AOY75699.1 hypothetical protein BJL90_07205 [Clostridium formicaceticum]ARE86019.1 hypothetical protein CLFO_03350 [Clostridium formicaceticum]
MVLEAIVLGLIVGKIRGGQFRRLGITTLRFSWVILLAFSLRLAISVMISLGHPVVIHYRMILYLASYILLFVALFFNMHFKCMWLITIGSITNFLAILLNKGSMPINMETLEKFGFENMLTSIQLGVLPQYIPMEEAELYSTYLGKGLSMPSIYPLKQIFSIGDLLIVIGIFFLVQHMMSSSLYHKTSRVLHFDHKSKPSL